MKRSAVPAGAVQEPGTEKENINTGGTLFPPENSKSLILSG